MYLIIHLRAVYYYVHFHLNILHNFAYYVHSVLYCTFKFPTNA